ncbi:MAG: DUF1289 domain-containing protein [Rubellimicrobium sp.]|nr:DUF1289 domain-containing protein [Rubellimicrobium sp.]
MTEQQHSDRIWKRAEIDSPCVKICQIHPDHGICIGCFRTAAEIAGWSAMDPATRAAVSAGLAARGLVLRQRRGGRSARLSRGEGG